MKTKTVQFDNDIEWIEGITPSKNHVPDWYKESPVDDRVIKSLPYFKSIKACAPFLDSFLTGYTMTTPVDISVEIVNGTPSITWSDGSIEVVSIRDRSQAPTLPTPTGYLSDHLTWKTQTVLKVPKGYSILYTHPLNRFDLPFLTLSAVVDADSIFPTGNIPFFLKENFEGFIPAGTPMAQVIPFKREPWVLKKVEGLSKEGKLKTKQSMSIMGLYKTSIWNKKEYK